MALLYNAMCGPGPGCVTALRPKLELPLSYPPGKRWRIAFSMDQGWAEIADDVRENTLAALRILEQCGATVEEVDLGLGLSEAELRPVMEKLLLSGALGAELADLAPRQDQLTSYGKYFVRRAGEMGLKDAKSCAEVILRLYKALDERVFQKGFAAVITPTTGTTRIPAEFDPTRDDVTINGTSVDPHIGWFLTSLFNLLNWMPVINVPTGLARNNVPTGMQIAAQTYDDHTAAAIASAYAHMAEPLWPLR